MGTAAIVDHPVGELGVDLPDLVLRGSVMEVQLVFPDGTPLADAAVQLHYITGPGVPREMPLSFESAQRAVKSPGLSETTVRTDAQGWFRAAGLRACGFSIHPANQMPAGLILLGSTSGGPRQRIVPASRLLISVLDENGKALDFETLEHWLWGADCGPELLAALAGHGTPGEIASKRWKLSFGRGAPTAPGPYTVLVPTNTWWYGRVRLEGGEELDELVFVGPAAGDLPVTFVRRPVERGRLRVRVFDPAGHPWAGPTILRVRNPMGAEVEYVTGAADQTVLLPAGNYDVEMSASRCVLRTGDCFLGLGQRVRVDGGGSHEVRLLARPAGHVGLRLRTFDGKHRKPPGAGGMAKTYPATPKKHVVLSSPGSLEPSVLNRFETVGRCGSDTADVPMLNANGPSIAPGHLAPGRYIVSVDLPGFAPVSARMDVRAGVSVVELMLSRNR